MMPQIPLKLLPDSIEVKLPVKGDYAGEVSEVAKRIANVLFIGSEDIDSTSYSLDDGSKGVIYIDAVNSGGAFKVPTGSRVKVDGIDEKMIVTKVTTQRGLWGRVHHWKVEVR